MRYAAFLRGINVGGHKQVKMEDLRKAFESLKFKNVKTYINSGNVLFDSEEKSDLIRKEIKDKLNKLLGYEIEVFIQNIKQLKNIIKLNPFKKAKKDEMKYATFLPSGLRISKLPISSQDNDVEVFFIKNDIAFSLSRKVKGKYGFPNGFIEKKFKVSATTRNWNTINKIINF